MSLARRIRRARGEHLRAIPADAAAVIVERQGDDFVLRLVPPATWQRGDKPSEQHALAAYAMSAAGALLAEEDPSDGETTTTRADERAGGHDGM